MNGRLVITTAPTVEPVTLAEVLMHTHADEGPEDSYIKDILIPSARLKAEEYLNRGFTSQSVSLIFDGFPCGQVLLPYSPVISVDNIYYYDTASTETEYATTNFDIDLESDPARINLKYGYSYPAVVLRPQSGYKINYTAGYGTSSADVPKKVKLGIMFLVGWWYENRGMEHAVPDAFYNILRPMRLHV